MSDKITRRHLLATSSAMGAGLIARAAGCRPSRRQAAQPEQDLPVGAAGKLTVIHRTEYFEAAQNKFREVCQGFADANGATLDISTTNPEAFGDFLGKMSAAVQAGNPPDFAYTSNVSIQQMALLGLLEDVTDVVDEAVAKYGNPMPGINADKLGKVDGKWMAVPFLAAPTGVFIRGDKLKEKGIDPATLTTWDARREAALAISDPANEFWGWGVTTNQSGDGWGVVTQHPQRLRRQLHRRNGHEGRLQLARDGRRLHLDRRDLRPQRQVRPDAAAGDRELGRHLEQRGVPRRQDRLHPQRVLGLRPVQARQEPGVPEHASC